MDNMSNIKRLRKQFLFHYFLRLGVIGACLAVVAAVIWSMYTGSPLF